MKKINNINLEVESQFVNDGKDFKAEIFEMPELEINDINVVYVGKPNACMCGCSGKYYYPKVNQKFASQKRGYEVTDDEIDDGKVKRVYNKMKKFAKDKIEVFASTGPDIDGIEYIFNIVIGKTQYTLYTV